jgi:hypothetical protein
MLKSVMREYWKAELGFVHDAGLFFYLQAYDPHGASLTVAPGVPMHTSAGLQSSGA